MRFSINEPVDVVGEGIKVHALSLANHDGNQEEIASFSCNYPSGKRGSIFGVLSSGKEET